MQPAEPPLDEIQPTFTSTATSALNGLKWTNTYHSATLLHRLAVDGSVSTLEHRYKDLTPNIVNNSKCWWEHEWENGDRFTFTEVRWKHHPPSLLTIYLSRRPRSTLHVSVARLSLRSACCEQELLLICQQRAVLMADSSPHSTMLLLTQSIVMENSAALSLMPVPLLGWGGALFRGETR